LLAGFQLLGALGTGGKFKHDCDNNSKDGSKDILLTAQVQVVQVHDFLCFWFISSAYLGAYLGADLDTRS